MVIKNCPKRNIVFFKHNVKNDAFRKRFSHNNNNWIKELIDGNLIDNFRPTNLDKNLEISDLDMSDKKSAKTDLKNAITVYSRLDITPIEASDEEMWAWMCLDEFYPYVRYRWGFNKDKHNAQNVLRRFFYDPDAIDSKSHNAMARLWWGTHLSHDSANTDDPFRYTRILFSSQDYVTGILERNYSNSKHVVLAYLKACEQIVSDGYNMDSRSIQLSCKFLDTLGGITILDCLNEEKLKNIITVHLRKILERKK